MWVFRWSKSLFKVSIKTVIALSVGMDGYKLVISNVTWIFSWVVSHVAASFTDDDKFITQCLFLFKVGCQLNILMFRMVQFL